MSAAFQDATPSNIEALKKAAADKASYKNRLEAIEELGKYRCRQSIDVLWRLMMNDKLHCVQHRAFLKLQAFGENVRLPRKKKGKLVKDIEHKIYVVSDRVSILSDEQGFFDEFKQRYPEAFDLYSCERGAKFKEFVLNILKSRPGHK